MKAEDRNIQIISLSGVFPFLIAEAAEVWIGEIGVPVNRDGKHVGAIVKYILLPVAVVVV